jgi:hypothetical protein
MTTFWSDKRTEFDNRRQQILQKWANISNKVDIGAIKNGLEQSIKSGGKLTTQQLSTMQTGIRSLFDTIREYELLVRDVNAYIQTNMLGSVTNNVNTIANMNQEISELKTKIQTMKSDYETAMSRRESIETPRKKISNYQGFSGLIAFDRPLKKYSVAILLAFGVFMIIVATMMLRDIFKDSPATSTNIFSGYANTSLNSTTGSASLFSPQNVVIMLGGMIFFFAVMGIFAYTGYLGKKL